MANDTPRSNVELYGRTADIAAAKAAGVAPAIAPDWSPTGSTGMLAELGYAERLRVSGPLKNVVTAQDLVEMATVNPARMAGLDSVIGKLAPGYAADLIVMRKRPAERGPDDSTRAFEALLKQGPADLLLVVLGGTPVYGEPGLMKKLLPSQPLESLTICGEPRAINVTMGAGPKTRWADTEALSLARRRSEQKLLTISLKAAISQAHVPPPRRASPGGALRSSSSGRRKREPSSLFAIGAERTPRFLVDVDMHALTLLQVRDLGPGTGWGRVPTPMY